MLIKRPWALGRRTTVQRLSVSTSLIVCVLLAIYFFFVSMVFLFSMVFYGLLCFLWSSMVSVIFYVSMVIYGLSMVCYFSCLWFLRSSCLWFSMVSVVINGLSMVFYHFYGFLWLSIAMILLLFFVFFFALVVYCFDSLKALCLFHIWFWSWTPSG